MLAVTARAVDDQGEGAIEALRLEEELLAVGLLVDLDEHGRGELVVARDELVVGLDLVIDGGGTRDALGAEHLLDLHERRVAVLEDARCIRAEGHAPRLLLRDDAGAKLLADAFVLGQAEDLAAFDGLHGVCASVESPYAPASASMG